MAHEPPAFNKAHWLTAADPADIAAVIFLESAERQMRLFMAACCRRVWQWMREERLAQDALLLSRRQS
jgi:hypothetical protein